MKKFIALLFLSFFSCNFAFAEALTLTHRGSIIPGGNNNFIGGRYSVLYENVYIVNKKCYYNLKYLQKST